MALFPGPVGLFGFGAGLPPLRDGSREIWGFE